MRLLLIKQCHSRIPRTYVESLFLRLQKHFRKIRMLNRAIVQKQELVLVFVNPQQMKKMNTRYRGKKYVTDVLSFSSKDPQIFGELVICLEKIRSQSKEHRMTFKQELAYMIIHGVLHLAGMDHETSESDAKKMFALQDRIFAELDL